MLASGTVLRDRYEILAKVGQGGMAMVYRARDLHFEARDVAVKQMAVLVPDEADRRDVIAQFKAEANILTRLAHPNIPRVIDLFQEADNHFLVMDFVEGQTLDRLAAPRGDAPAARPSVATILGWGLQVAEALTYLHGQSPQPVVYKDLKPQNLILTPEGRVMLLDFGIAKAPDRHGVSRTILKGAGTPGFAAPEQYTPGASDPRVDLYALGATLHTLLTGKVPIDAYCRNEDLQSGAPDPLQAPSSANRAVPPEVDAFLARLMAMQPSDRPPSAREVAMDLEKLRDAAAERKAPPTEVGGCPSTGTSRSDAGAPGRGAVPATLEESGGRPAHGMSESDAAARGRGAVPATLEESGARPAHGMAESDTAARGRGAIPATLEESGGRPAHGMSESDAGAPGRGAVPATLEEGGGRPGNGMSESDAGAPGRGAVPATLEESGGRPAHGMSTAVSGARDRTPVTDDADRSKGAIVGTAVGPSLAHPAYGPADDPPPGELPPHLLAHPAYGPADDPPPGELPPPPLAHPAYGPADAPPPGELPPPPLAHPALGPADDPPPGELPPPPLAHPAYGPADDPPPPRSLHRARDAGRSRAGLAAALVLGGALVAGIVWGKASSSPPLPTPIPLVSPSSVSVPAAGVPIPTPTIFTPESSG